jgi:hypothetical protein
MWRARKTGTIHNGQMRTQEFDRLVQLYRNREQSSAASRLEILMDLEHLGDLRTVPFMLQVLADQAEIRQVRVHALKWLKEARFTPADRPRVAEALRQIAETRSGDCLRLHAVLALAAFADVDGVPAALGALALDCHEPVDIRYSAFTSLEKAGLTTEAIAVLQSLAADKLLGSCARSALSLWRSV